MEEQGWLDQLQFHDLERAGSVGDHVDPGIECLGRGGSERRLGELDRTTRRDAIFVDSPEVRLNPEFAGYRGLDHRMAIFSAEQDDRPFARGDGRLERLDHHPLAGDIVGHRIMDIEPIGAVGTARDRRFDDQIDRPELCRGGGQRGGAQMVDVKRRDGWNILGRQLLEIGLVAIPPEQFGRVEQRPAFYFGALDHA